MFVSTRGSQARCIRCGAILGARNELRIASKLPPNGTGEPRASETSVMAEKPPIEREAIVRRVSLCVISSVKLSGGRERAGGVRWMQRLAAMWPVVAPNKV